VDAGPDTLGAMRKGALAWAAAAAVLLALLIALVVNIRSNADASAPTASTAASPTVANASAPPPPPPRSLKPPPPLEPRSPLPEPPPGTKRPGPAPAPEVVELSAADRAARTLLQYDTADFGKVVETLEDGTAVGRVRGQPVTDAEQERVRKEVAKMASAYETAYDDALVAGNEPEFARAVHAAREQFDRNVRELYHLTDQQFFELFPHRKDGAPRSGQ
jgi:hypothetical protein